MTGLAMMWVHEVQVETVSTVNYAARYAAPVPFKCWIDEGTASDETAGARSDSTARSGIQVTTLFGPLEGRSLFPPDSVVTLPDGQRSKVAALVPFDSGSLRLPTDHIEVTLAPTLPAYYEPSAD